MDFDLSKVYTSANADELHAGDVVVLADSMADLRMKVAEAEVSNCKRRLTEIGDEDHQYRFRTAGGSYALAYLIDSTPGLSWAELAIGDIIKAKDGSITRMITGINVDEDANDAYIHIEAGYMYISDEDLAEGWVKCE